MQNKISLEKLYRLGISIQNFNTVNTLEDLRENPPNIVIANCKKDIRFSQNRFSEQTLHKKNNYVMSTSIFMQLHYNEKTKNTFLKPSEIKFNKIYKPYKGQNLDNKIILVFRQGGIGDLLFILPNLSYLKQKYPTCTINFACGPQYQSMVKEWDCVDKVLDLPFNVNEIFKADYHAIFEGVIERCKDAEHISSYNLFSKWLGLDLPNELLVPKQKPNEESVYKIKEILKNLEIEEKDFIVLQIRASSPIRSPNPRVWVKLIDMLTEKGHKILITDNPLVSYEIDDFISHLKDKDKVFNFSKYSEVIGDTIALTSLAKLVISTDSAMSHIPVSVGIKSFVIMGPFPGRVRLSTYPKEMCDWVDVKSIDGCTECFQHGTNPCKKAMNSPSSPCYDNLDYDLCIKKIERLLNV